MADLEGLSVPYPALLAEYQERIGKLTNENVMLHAAIGHLQATTQPIAPAPMPGLPQLADAQAPPREE